MLIYDDYLKIYTDGSKTAIGVGAAIVVGDSDYSWCLKHYSNIYTAESFAIWQALLYLQSSGKNKCLILTDSLSVLTALENEFTREESIVRILDQVQLLKDNNKSVTFMWIPSHSGIQGNERADRSAKAAANSDYPDEGIPTPSRDLVTYIKTSVVQVWQEEWNLYNGHMRHIKPTVESLRYPKELTRREQVILCRLRIGHTNLTHSHLLTRGTTPRCTNCDEILTVKHFLSECPLYTSLKRRLQMNIDLPRILSTSLPNVEILFTFLKEINLYHKI
nr:unnamed protein product [Callosobruchus chinensis]